MDKPLRGLVAGGRVFKDEHPPQGPIKRKTATHPPKQSHRAPEKKSISIENQSGR